MKNQLLALTRRSIPYLPDLRTIAGSVTASILMQQLDYWFSHKPNGFYKFLSPCTHDQYKPGDSWEEELRFSPDEFRVAFDRIGVRHSSKTAYKKAVEAGREFFSNDEIPIQKFYSSYHDRTKGLTYYFRNNPLVDSTLESLCSGNFSVTGKSPVTEQVPPIIPVSVTRQSPVTSNEDNPSYGNGKSPVTLYTEITQEITPEITNPPLPPQRGEEGVHESKADDFRQEQEEGETVAVKVEIVTEEEIKNKIDPSVESGKQPIQSINSNPGVDLGSALARDNNAIPAQKLERIKRNIELLDSGKVERLPRHEFNEVAEYVIGPYASLYRKSGKLNNRERVNDIKPEFLAYVEKNILSSKLRNEGNAVKYVRNSELNPDRWESLIADVKGWLKQEYKSLGQPTQTPKEKHQTQQELRKMMLSTRI